NEATGTAKGTESPKKKSGNEEDDSEPVVEEDGQTALFGEPKEKPTGPLVNGQPPKAKGPTKEVKQADLFGEEKKEVDDKKDKGDDKAFGVGETIDLDI
ncbi:MAG: hypothetical protein ACK5UP_04375, partial [Bacteroidota bacterium]